MNYTGKKLKFRAATIGCGRMGAFHSSTVSEHAPNFWMPISHLAAINCLDNIEAVACCDIKKENIDRAQKMYNIPRTYTDPMTMLKEEKLDLITIATRTPQKASLISEAILAGVSAIHVEKPLCNTFVELNDLRNLATKKNALISYGCIRRYLPPYKIAKKHIKSQKFGNLEDINIEMGSCSLIWSLIHGIDLILYYAFPAKPKFVQAWFENVITTNNYKYLVQNDPKIIAATILFDNGITGRISRTSGDAITLSSSKSRIEIFSDGAQVFSSHIPNEKVYQCRNILNWDKDKFNNSKGGSSRPINLLLEALQKNPLAIQEIKDTMGDMFNGQSLIFDLIHSHFKGGKYVEINNYPYDIGILGITDGRPA